VYPHSSLWLTTNSPNTIIHTHLIGSTEPLAIDYQMVNEKLRKNAFVSDQLDYVTLSNAFDFIGQCAMGEEKLREFTSDVTQINTDNLPVAEFFRKIGRQLYTKEECPTLLLQDIVRYKENALSCVVNIPPSEREGLEEKMSAYCKGDSLRIEGHCCYMRSFALLKAKGSKDYLSEAYRYYNKAYQYYSEAQHYLPDDRFLKEFFIEAARVISQ
jgi:hypothetical protein